MGPPTSTTNEFVRSSGRFLWVDSAKGGHRPLPNSVMAERREVLVATNSSGLVICCMPLSLWIHIPFEKKAIGDRFGGSKYLLRRYLDF